jgi:hypothetical protein
MQIPLRPAGLVAFTLSICVPASAVACSIPPPPPPPPRAAGESEAAFVVRRDNWYRGITEQQRQEALPLMAANEDRLWVTSERIVLARVVSIRSTWLRGSEGQRYSSPLVTLRPIQWLKGLGTVRRLQVHYLSDDSCAFGGAGDAPEGEVGDLILLFYRHGFIEPRNVLDTFSRDRVVTQRSQRAFDLGDGQRTQ